MLNIKKKSTETPEKTTVSIEIHGMHTPDLMKLPVKLLGQCTAQPVETNYRKLPNRQRWCPVCGR